MQTERFFAAAGATAATLATLMLCAASAGFSAPAHADGVVRANGVAVGSAQGPWAGRAGFSANGNSLDAAGRRRIAGDGQGNVNASGASGFNTAAGGQGLRTRQFNRSADGSVNASGQASASGANGSAERSGSFNRNADGSASGERSTTVTNSNTGTTLDGSTTYTKGSGVSRSVACTDANGNTVSCGSR